MYTGLWYDLKFKCSFQTKLFLAGVFLYSSFFFFYTVSSLQFWG